MDDKLGYKSFASGYLVKDGKVLLVHHNKFDKWVPPGGHIEIGETPADAMIREFVEETGFIVEALPSMPPAFEGDDNATPIPLPFHMDLEVEGFDVPHIGHFYYVKDTGERAEATHQELELLGIDWFSKEDLETLKTFEQVRALASHAIDNYPEK